MVSQGVWPGPVYWIKKDSQVATSEAMSWLEMFREGVLYGRVKLIECWTLYNKLAKGKYPIQLARTLPTSTE